MTAATADDPPATSDTGEDETRWDRMFRLDALHDGLLSGRLCGTAFDPGTAQLLLVLLERLDWSPDTRQLAGAMPHFPERFGADEIRSTLAVLGYHSTEGTLPGRRLADCPPETLVEDRGGALWLPRTDGRRPHLVQPNDDDEHSVRVRRAETYRVIRFERLAAAARSGPQGWMGETVSRFAPEIRLMFLLTALSGSTAILITFGITTIFDTVIPTRNHQTLAGIALGLALVFLHDFALRRIRARLIGRLSGRLEFILGSALLAKLMRLPPAMLTGVTLGDQLARLRQFESIRDLFAGPAALLVLELPLALLLLAAVAVIAWPIALLLAAYAALFLAAALMMAPAIRRATARQSTAQSALNRVLLEVISQRRQIARLGLADHWTERAGARVRDLARARRRLAALSRWLEALSYASLPFAAASVIGLGAVLVMRGELTGGALVGATILTWRLFAPVQQTLVFLPKLQDVRRLGQQIDALMRLPEEDSDGEGSFPKQREGALSTQGLVFRHPNSIAPTLMGVQLDIPHGAFVAVTGKSGSGKSTLLRALAGQLAPQAGVVLFNGLNLNQLSRTFRARNIVYVSQEPLFFFGTVAQNLRLADPAADDVRLAAVLDEVGLAAWVADLPRGLDTRIDPAVDGDLLTPGVLTGIGVAQALLVDPVALLLDEPAGTMDAAHEAALIAALERRRGRTTCVMVTHRPSLMRRTDSVIFLNAGAAVMRATADLERAAS